MEDFAAEKELFLDLSLGQLADMTDVDAKTWASWFDCKSPPSIAVLYKVADSLAISVGAILKVFEEQQAKIWG